MLSGRQDTRGGGRVVGLDQGHCFRPTGPSARKSTCAAGSFGAVERCRRPRRRPSDRERRRGDSIERCDATLDTAVRFAAGQTAGARVANLAEAALREMGLLKGKAVAAPLLAATIFAAGTGTLINRMAVVAADAAESRGGQIAAKRVDMHGDRCRPSDRSPGNGAALPGRGSPIRRLLARRKIAGFIGVLDRRTRLHSALGRGDGKELRRFPGNSSYLTFSPDSHLFAASHEFGQLCLWNASTGKQLWCTGM